MVARPIYCRRAPAARFFQCEGQGLGSGRGRLPSGAQGPDLAAVRGSARETIKSIAVGLQGEAHTLHAWHLAFNKVGQYIQYMDSKVKLVDGIKPMWFDMRVSDRDRLPPHACATRGDRRGAHGRAPTVQSYQHRPRLVRYQRFHRAENSQGQRKSLISAFCDHDGFARYVSVVTGNESRIAAVATSL